MSEPQIPDRPAPRTAIEAAPEDRATHPRPGPLEPSEGPVTRFGQQRRPLRLRISDRARERLTRGGKVDYAALSAITGFAAGVNEDRSRSTLGDTLGAGRRRYTVEVGGDPQE